MAELSLTQEMERLIEEDGSLTSPPACSSEAARPKRRRTSTDDMSNAERADSQELPDSLGEESASHVDDRMDVDSEPANGDADGGVLNDLRDFRRNVPPMIRKKSDAPEVHALW